MNLKEHFSNTLARFGYLAVWNSDSVCIDHDGSKYYLLLDTHGRIINSRTGHRTGLQPYGYVLPDAHAILEVVDDYIPELGIRHDYFEYVVRTMDRFESYVAGTPFECGRHHAFEMSLVAGQMQINLAFIPTPDNSRITIRITRNYKRGSRTIIVNADDPEGMYRAVCDDELSRSLWNMPQYKTFNAPSCRTYTASASNAVSFGVHSAYACGMVEIDGNKYKDIGTKPVEQAYFKICCIAKLGIEHHIITDGERWYQCLDLIPGMILETPSVYLGAAHKELITTSIKLFVESWRADNCF